ncbi:dihydropteroate synthase [Rhodococcoides trifolii]|uniref:Dihydropteroate synthase n=1 Tax=Rhodococcoides trifolii TaxID=908250 RepID=A0A917G8P4_9NOCA|nr:dihydropteroate synthase [Rhodococcus trifolii]GGG28736.1 dihydropteroate synthase [Rhodococcus trifolii]
MTGTRLMGIVNVTPDSFSDGGKHVDPRRAVEHAQRMIADGADLVDVGGESTRPGAVRVDADEEQRRVLPVVRDLVASRVAVSVDTMRARTAAAALEAGAVVINDVSGGLADPDMSAVVAGSGATYVVTHWRGHSAEMVTLAHYDDVVGDVCSDLLRRVDELVAAGVDGAQIILDPGLGFAKRVEHDWRLLASLHRIVELGFPVLVGASRKSFLGEITRKPDGTVDPPADRDVTTAAVTALAVAAGVAVVRVHDVAANLRAVACAAPQRISCRA